jgi:hypothetical protein
MRNRRRGRSDEGETTKESDGESGGVNGGERERE